MRDYERKISPKRKTFRVSLLKKKEERFLFYACESLLRRHLCKERKREQERTAVGVIASEPSLVLWLRR